MVKPTPIRGNPIADVRRFSSYKGTEPGPTFWIDDDEFHCVRMPAGQTLARLASSLYVNDRGEEGYHLPNLVTFIEECLAEELPVEQAAPDNRTNEEIEQGVEAPAPVMVTEPCDDIERWRALMANKAQPVPPKELGEITVWLSTWYNDRPTTPSSR